MALRFTEHVGDSADNDFTNALAENIYFGLQGSDTLSAGTMTDFALLSGGAGGDVYEVGSGGSAVILDFGGTGSDTVRATEIELGALETFSATIDGQHLMVINFSTQQAFFIIDYLAAANQIESFVLGDGTFDAATALTTLLDDDHFLGDLGWDQLTEGLGQPWTSSEATEAFAYYKTRAAVLAGESLAPSVGDHPDTNGDGRSDILLVKGQQLALWFVNGTAFEGGGSLNSLNTGWSVGGRADFNGDGKDDLLLSNGSNMGIWLLNGTQVTTGSGIGALGANWTIAGTSDFDGDGKGDILLFNTATRALGVWQMDGAQRVGGGTVANLGAGWVPAGTGDFDGDGKGDVLLYKSSNQQLAIWRLNGSQLLGGGLVGTLGTGWAPVGTGDFNGDGTADILLQNGSLIATWLIENAAKTTGGLLGSLSGGWSTAGTGDFNGDGRTDLLLQTTLGDGRIRLAGWLVNNGAVAGGGTIAELGTGWAPAFT